MLSKWLDYVTVTEHIATNGESNENVYAQVTRRSTDRNPTIFAVIAMSKVLQVGEKSACKIMYCDKIKQYSEGQSVKYNVIRYNDNEQVRYGEMEQNKYSSKYNLV